jgi:Tat protein translocase TatB subunit
MLGLGMSEILLVCAVVLVAVGPDRLPQMMRSLGRYYGKMRRSADELRRAFVLEADRQDAEERIDDLREQREQAAKDAEKGEVTGVTGTFSQPEEWPETAEKPPSDVSEGEPDDA